MQRRLVRRIEMIARRADHGERVWGLEDHETSRAERSEGAVNDVNDVREREMFEDVERCHRTERPFRELLEMVDRVLVADIEPPLPTLIDKDLVRIHPVRGDSALA